MGYVKHPLIITDTSEGKIKHFVMPDDVGEKKFVIFVIRNK